MKSNIKVFAGASIMAFGLFVTGCGNTDPVGKIIAVKGDIKTKTATEASFTTATIDQSLISGDSIKTGEDSNVELELLNDKSQITLNSNTFLEIRNFSEKELRQMSGIAIYRINPQNRELKIQTPQGMATVLGTVFRVDSSQSETIVTVEKGRVGFKPAAGAQVIIEEGMQFSSSQKDEKPVTLDPLEREQLFNSGSGLRPVINPR